MPLTGSEALKLTSSSRSSSPGHYCESVPHTREKSPSDLLESSLCAQAAEDAHTNMLARSGRGGPGHFGLAECVYYSINHRKPREHTHTPVWWWVSLYLAFITYVPCCLPRLWMSPACWLVSHDLLLLSSSVLKTIWLGRRYLFANLTRGARGKGWRNSVLCFFGQTVTYKMCWWEQKT